MTTPLKFPFTNAAGQRIEAVSTKRLKRSDLKAAHRHAPTDDIEQEDFLLARMTGLTLEDIDQLDVADSKALTDTFRDMVSGRDNSAAAGQVPADSAADTAV